MPREKVRTGPSSSRDTGPLLVPLGVVTMVCLTAAVIATGVPPGPSGTATVVLMALVGPLSAVTLSGRIRDLRLIVPVLVAFGLAGAGLDWPQSDGPGFVAAYMALVGLALRAPRRIALLGAIPVLLAMAAAESHDSSAPASTFLATVLGASFLFTTSAYAGMSLDARQHAEAMLAQEAATRRAREQAAALAERSRLARELHDVIAHSLSGLSVQLEASRLMAATSGADARLVDQIEGAHRLAVGGMANAQRAVQTLRGDRMPGPAELPRLIEETSAASGIPVSLEVHGTPQDLAPEAGLTVYRMVQEALTNVGKHAGNGARVTVALRWAGDSVEATVADVDGDGVGAGLTSGGLGLTSMAERAALLGGELTAASSDRGFTVRMRLPCQLPGVPGVPGRT